MESKNSPKIFWVKKQLLKMDSLVHEMCLPPVECQEVKMARSEFLKNTALLFTWHMGFMLELATGLWGAWLHMLQKQHDA